MLRDGMVTFQCHCRQWLQLKFMFDGADGVVLFFKIRVYFTWVKANLVQNLLDDDSVGWKKSVLFQEDIDCHFDFRSSAFHITTTHFTPVAAIY